MSMEEKQNFPTYQDSDLLFPKSEKELAEIIKKFYKFNSPIEVLGSGSKRQIGKQLQCAKTVCLTKLDGIKELLLFEFGI